MAKCPCTLRGEILFFVRSPLQKGATTSGIALSTKTPEALTATSGFHTTAQTHTHTFHKMSNQQWATARRRQSQASSAVGLHASYTRPNHNYWSKHSAQRLSSQCCPAPDWVWALPRMAWPRTVQEPQGMQPTYVVLARYSGVEDTKGARPSWQPNRNHHHQYDQADVDQTMLPRQPLLHATSVDDVLSAMMCRPTAPPQRGSHVTKALGRELHTKNTYLTKRANKKCPIISSTLFNLLNYQVP